MPAGHPFQGSQPKHLDTLQKPKGIRIVFSLQIFEEKKFLTNLFSYQILLHLIFSKYQQVQDVQQVRGGKYPPILPLHYPKA